MAKTAATPDSAPPASSPPKWFAVLRTTRGLRTGNWSAPASAESAPPTPNPSRAAPSHPAPCDAPHAEGERKITEARVGVIHAFALPAALLAVTFAVPMIIRTFANVPSDVITTLRSIQIMAPLIVILVLSGCLSIRSNRFVLTNQRVCFKTGVMCRRRHALFLHEIQDVTVERTVLGTFAKHGTVIVHTPGGDRIAMEGIARPERFQRRILEQVAGGVPG